LLDGVGLMCQLPAGHREPVVHEHTRAHRGAHATPRPACGTGWRPARTFPAVVLRNLDRVWCSVGRIDDLPCPGSLGWRRSCVPGGAPSVAPCSVSPCFVGVWSRLRGQRSDTPYLRHPYSIATAWARRRQWPDKRRANRFARGGPLSADTGPEAPSWQRGREHGTRCPRWRWPETTAGCWSGAVGPGARETRCPSATGGWITLRTAIPACGRNRFSDNEVAGVFLCQGTTVCCDARVAVSSVQQAVHSSQSARSRRDGPGGRDGAV
jgi:hypothetical protein